AVSLGGRRMGAGGAGADPHRHGAGRRQGRRRDRRPRRQRDRAGRGHKRRVGHAGYGGACGNLLGRAAARSDRSQSHSSILRRAVVTPADYDYLRKLLRERSGLVLSADKQYLVESRLLPLARRIGAAHLAELVVRLKAPGAEPLIVDVVEAMTTNESFFFRDKIPFDHFREHMLPSLLKARAAQRRLRI